MKKRTLCQSSLKEILALCHPSSILSRHLLCMEKVHTSLGFQESLMVQNFSSYSHRKDQLHIDDKACLPGKKGLLLFPLQHLLQYFFHLICQTCAWLLCQGPIPNLFY